MSTRCLIGLKENNEVEYIYCHHDGYVQGGVGETLLKHYNYHDVKRLLELGDISSLGNQPKSLAILWDNEFFSRYFNNDKYHASYREISDNYCAAYKDRGERGVGAKLVDANQYGFKCQPDAEFIYMFDADSREWLYLNYDSSEFTKLTPESE